MKYNIRNKHCHEFDCFGQNGSGKCTVLEETYLYHEKCPFYKKNDDLQTTRRADLQTYRYAVRRIADLHDELLSAKRYVDELKCKLSEERRYKTQLKTRIKKRMREEGRL